MNVTQYAALLTMQKMATDKVLAIARSTKPKSPGVNEWVVAPKKGAQPGIAELMIKVNPEP